VPAWAALLAAVALGPALGPGFVLSYDMVFVPDPTFSWSQLGLGPELPRAVPLDAVTTAVSAAVPAVVLQKAVLLGALVAAGTGAAALVPGLPLAARLVAVTVATWNPYVAERLVLGHWGLLLAYGTLPWLVLALRRSAPGISGVARAVLLLAVCALTPTGGLLSLAVLLVVGSSSHRTARRPLMPLLPAWLLLNATWWLPGFLHASSGGSDASGVEVFSARAELPGGVLTTLVGLGGVWNEDVVPDSRTTPLAVAGLLILVGLAVTGVRTLVGRDRRLARELGVLALVGLALALLGAVGGSRAVLEWLVSTVPGAGLLRDGQKFVALVVPLLSTLAACGAARLAHAVPDRVAAGAVLVGISLLHLAMLPDLAWGAGGRLDAVHYPPAWSAARAEIAAEPARGDLVLLPWSAFRAYEWNADRTVLDPGRRYFPRDAVADDRLAVGRVVIDPEDPRTAAVGRELARGRLDADFLRAQGVRLVLVQTDESVETDTVPGTEPVLRRPGLLLLRVPGPVAPEPSGPGGDAGRLAVVLVDVLAAGLVAAAAVVAARREGVGR
jgi:hypothetical protein